MVLKLGNLAIIPKCSKYARFCPIKMAVLSVSISPSRSSDFRRGHISRISSVPISVRKLRPSRLRVCVKVGGREGGKRKGEREGGKRKGERGREGKEDGWREEEEEETG